MKKIICVLLTLSSQFSFANDCKRISSLESEARTAAMRTEAYNDGVVNLFNELAKESQTRVKQSATLLIASASLLGVTTAFAGLAGAAGGLSSLSAVEAALANRAIIGFTMATAPLQMATTSLTIAPAAMAITAIVSYSTGIAFTFIESIALVSAGVYQLTFKGLEPVTININDTRSEKELLSSIEANDEIISAKVANSPTELNNVKTGGRAHAKHLSDLASIANENLESYKKIQLAREMKLSVVKIACAK